MSSEEVDYQRKVFAEFYKIIENFLYAGRYYCLCDHYRGCQTEMDFIMNIKNYCCICLFDQHFDTGTLHRIKRNAVELRSYYNEIMKVVCEALKLGCLNFWEQDVYYTIQNVNKGTFNLCNLSEGMKGFVYMIDVFMYPDDAAQKT